MPAEDTVFWILYDKYMFWVQTTRGRAPINKHYKAKIKETYKGSWVTEIFCSKERLIRAPNNSFVPGAEIYKTNYVAEKPKKQEPKKVVVKIPDLTNSKWNVQKPKGVKKFLN